MKKKKKKKVKAGPVGCSPIPQQNLAKGTRSGKCGRDVVKRNIREENPRRGKHTQPRMEKRVQGSSSEEKEVPGLIIVAHLSFSGHGLHPARETNAWAAGTPTSQNRDTGHPSLTLPQEFGKDD